MSFGAVVISALKVYKNILSGVTFVLLFLCPFVYVVTTNTSAFLWHDPRPLLTSTCYWMNMQSIICIIRHLVRTSLLISVDTD